MRNVIVVGAGVGGLYAAKRLSELGYHVKIIEARAREELGYPWYDSVGISTFRSVGMKLPEGTTIPKQILNFYAPSGEGKIKQPTRFARGLDVQREKLVRHMIAMCEPHCQFLFKEKVKELIIEDNAVKGVRTEKRTLHSDLVIDASGLFSPCRLSTPDSFYLNDPIGKTDYIVAYREEYSRKDVEGEPEPNVYLYPKNLMLAWCKSEPDTGGLDVFFGNYGDVTDEEKAEGIRRLRRFAGLGFIEARYKLGECYLDGAGVPQDKAEGVKWLRLAARQRHPLAMWDLYEALRDPDPPHSRLEAEKWRTLAIQDGEFDSVPEYWYWWTMNELPRYIWNAIGKLLAKIW